MIHQYKLGNLCVVLDVCSGSVHAVDEVAYDMIAGFETQERETLVDALAEKYRDREDVTRSELEECYDQLLALKDAGKLFTEDTFAPMAGELEVEWRGRDITIRRGPKNGAPFAAFSAVYTGTEEPVPGLTADTCGELLTGVGREVFQRSAFLGSGGDLSVTAAPELERRIAALVSSGQEDVSFSQTQARLREWLNRRRVNKSVGQIPKLEQELSQVEEQAEALSALCGEIARLEEAVRTLERERADALSRLRRSRQAAQNQLDQTRQEARSALDEAREQLEQLEQICGQQPGTNETDRE